MGIYIPSGRIAPSYNYIRTVTFSNPLILDVRESNAWYCRITGDTTIKIINDRVGGSYLVQLDMDDVGGHTITLNSKFRGTVKHSHSIDTAPGAVNMISIIRNRGGFFTYNIIGMNVSSTTTSTTSTV